MDGEGLAGAGLLDATAWPAVGVAPDAVEFVAGRVGGLEFEEFGHIDVKVLCGGGGVAKSEDTFAGGPGGPAVDFQLVGIAADPVDVFEGIGVGAAPAGCFGQRVPVGGCEELGCDVHLLELGAGAEVGVDFVGEVVVGVGGEVFGVLRVDDAVEHEGVDGEERTLEDDVFVGLGVAVGDPALTLGADAGEVAGRRRRARWSRRRRARRARRWYRW